MEKEKVIGLIVVYTGEYFKYFDKFWETFKVNFCGGNAKLYVFTDRPLCDLPDDPRIVRIPTNHLGFPIMPLLRWHLVKHAEDKLTEDYLYLIDGDVYFESKVTEGELKTGLAGTLHRNIEKQRSDYNYENRKESTAYVYPHEGDKYFACGFVGGERERFLAMTNTLVKNIDSDIKKGIRAVWGDESHLNRYFIDNKPSKIFSPEYMCPENNIKFNKKIVHVYKDFKKINIEDTKDYLTVNPEDFKNINIGGRRILITGHRGYIGSKLYSNMKAVGYNVFGIDREEGNDINNKTSDVMLKENEYDVVIHLSAQTGAIPSMKNPRQDAVDNILATLKIIKNNPDARIIFATSGASLDPESPYGVSKQACERYLKILHKDYVICRLSSIFGGKDRGVVDNFIRDEEPIVYGDGSAVRDFVYVYDIISALYKALEWEVGEYILGSGVGTSVKELANATGKKIIYKEHRQGEKQEVILQNTTPNWTPKKSPVEFIEKELRDIEFLK